VSHLPRLKGVRKKWRRSVGSGRLALPHTHFQQEIIITLSIFLVSDLSRLSSFCCSKNLTILYLSASFFSLSACRAAQGWRVSVLFVCVRARAFSARSAKHGQKQNGVHLGLGRQRDLQLLDLSRPPQSTSTPPRARV
jgi:hypothetical protein